MTEGLILPSPPTSKAHPKATPFYFFPEFSPRKRSLEERAERELLLPLLLLLLLLLRMTERKEKESEYDYYDDYDEVCSTSARVLIRESDMGVPARLTNDRYQGH